MKTVLAIIGGCVLALFLLGAVGIGHFSLTYLPYRLECQKLP